jgi:hypothetical protein
MGEYEVNLLTEDLSCTAWLTEPLNLNSARVASIQRQSLPGAMDCARAPNRRYHGGTPELPPDNRSEMEPSMFETWTIYILIQLILF